MVISFDPMLNCVNGNSGPCGTTVAGTTVTLDTTGILDGEESDIGFFGMRKNYIGCHCSRKDIYKVMIDWQLKLIGFAGVK